MIIKGDIYRRSFCFLAILTLTLNGQNKIPAMVASSGRSHSSAWMQLSMDQIEAIRLSGQMHGAVYDAHQAVPVLQSYGMIWS